MSVGAALDTLCRFMHIFPMLQGSFIPSSFVA